MTTEFYPGHRVSFDGELCTVRYVGLVAATKGTWLGVEWDDPGRGKHSGEHNGVTYFECINKQRLTGSFVRPSRLFDPPRSFTNALRNKYVSDVPDAALTNGLSIKIEDSPIQISGKEVEEVGFEKVQRQLANLQALRILVLDGQRINRPGARNLSRLASECNNAEIQSDVEKTCPSVTELDLSRNLFEEWAEVVDICRQIPGLSMLTAEGNRFKPLEKEDVTFLQTSGALQRLEALNLNDTLVTWEAVEKIVSPLSKLASLSLAGNQLSDGLQFMLPKSLTSLNLDRNEFQSLVSLEPLSRLESLRKLSLKRNHIGVQSPRTNGDTAKESFVVLGNLLSDVDLSFNNVSDWQFVDQLARVFPTLSSLRIANNPLYHKYKTAAGTQTSADDGFILTVARLGGLTVLNSSEVTPKERFNAETFYLSQIAKELSVARVDQRSTIIASHARYNELCARYGEPVILQTQHTAIDPNSLAARLVKITFKLHHSLSAERSSEALHAQISIDLEVPRSLTVYNLQGMLGKRLGMPPMLLRLVWETGEKDVAPVDVLSEEHPGLREEVLVPQSRSIGSWLEEGHATVRVEWNDEEAQGVAAAKDIFNYRSSV